MTVKELKEFIKDLPDETIVINNVSGRWRSWFNL